MILSYEVVQESHEDEWSDLQLLQMLPEIEASYLYVYSEHILKALLRVRYLSEISVLAIMP